jgi:hypothetical protein
MFSKWNEYYTDEKVAALKEAFELVENPEHWKGRIEARVSEEAAEKIGGLLIISEAVKYYTATEATITRVRSGGFLVESDGYWSGPAN